jgi:hypothetical protein
MLLNDGTVPYRDVESQDKILMGDDELLFTYSPPESSENEIKLGDR